MSVAGVAHLVERHLAKVEVASSSLVARSIEQIRKYLLFFCAFSQARRMKSDSPVDCQSPPFPAGIQKKDEGAPLPMEEMPLKRYHLNTLILKIFSDY